MIWVAGLLLTTGLASCEMKDELKGNVGVISSEVGYLDLDVAIGQKTRANEMTSVSTDDFPVEIKGTDVDYTKTFESYEALTKELPIALPVGNYAVSAHTNAELKAVMDIPYYSGETPLTITKGVTANAEVVCKMKNTKIQLVYDTEFSTTFKEWDITISDGSANILTYDETDLNPKAKYWLVADNVKTIKMHVDAVTQDGTKVSEDRSISKPDDADSDFWAGSDALTVTMEPGEPTDPENPNGVTGIKVTVQISFDDNEQEDIVEVPVEDDDPDPVPPAPGAEPSIAIPQSTYTLPGDAEKNADATITAEAGIKSVKVQIVPGNEMFTSIVSGMFGVEPFELIGNETLGAVFSGMGISLPDVGDTEYIFPVGNFFSLLSEMGTTEASEGHVFNITVEDNNGKTASASLGVIVE
jgi:hypothetical protein